jgi:hypothetical protein
MVAESNKEITQKWKDSNEKWKQITKKQTKLRITIKKLK